MLEKFPQEIQGLITGLVGLVPTAALARFLYHHRLVRLGHRRFWSIDLVWEMPTAAFSAVIGGGLASYFALGLPETHAVVGACAWLGPRGMEVVLARVVEKYAPKGK